MAKSTGLLERAVVGGRASAGGASARGAAAGDGTAEGVAGAVIGREVVTEGRFLRLVQLQYKRPPRSDVVRQWQSVERCTTDRSAGSHGIDAVAVFAVVKSKSRSPQLIVIKQFRPPLGMTTVELPAGLVDAGEDPQAAALRELQEETGFAAARVLATGGSSTSVPASPTSAS